MALLHRRRRELPAEGELVEEVLHIGVCRVDIRMQTAFEWKGSEWGGPRRSYQRRWNKCALSDRHAASHN